MKKINKAIIPAAGMGTRLLPATKAIPKEMLPIINVPTIQMIVQEAIDAGIKNILIVISKSKEAIISHFRPNKGLEKILVERNKKQYADLVKKTGNLAKIDFIYQKQPLGLGHAIGCCEKWVNNEPFAVLLGDDVVARNKTQEPALKQCIDAFYKTNGCVVGIQPVAEEVISKYGIVKPINKKDLTKKIFKLEDMVEKPEVSQAPSNYAALGRYVFTNDIFSFIKKTRRDKSGEIQITDALRAMMKTPHGIYGCVFSGTRYDLGNKLGMVKAIIDFALKDEEISSGVKEYLKRSVRLWQY